MCDWIERPWDGHLPARWLEINHFHRYWKIETTARDHASDEDVWYLMCRFGGSRTSLGIRETKTSFNCPAKIKCCIDRERNIVRMQDEPDPGHNHDTSHEFYATWTRPDDMICAEIGRLAVQGMSCTQIRTHLRLLTKPSIVQHIMKKEKKKILGTIQFREQQRQRHDTLKRMLLRWREEFPYLTEDQFRILEQSPVLLSLFINQIAAHKDPKSLRDVVAVYRKQWDSYGYSLIEGGMTTEGAVANIFLLNFGVPLTDTILRGKIFHMLQNGWESLDEAESNSFRIPPGAEVIEIE